MSFLCLVWPVGELFKILIFEQAGFFKPKDLLDDFDSSLLLHRQDYAVFHALA